MSDPSIWASGPARLAAYPDDEEANICVTDTLRVYCEHTIDQERRMATNACNVFEVVPPLNKGEAPKKGQKGAKKGGDSSGTKRQRKGGDRHDGRRGTEKVTLVHSGEQTPTLAQAPDGESDKSLEEKSPEGGVPRYVLECTAHSPDLALLDKEFWQKLKEPRVYEIDGVGDGPFTIKSFCPDRFTLALDFPAMKSISAGVKIEEKEDEAEEVDEENRKVTTTVEESTWSPTDQQMQTVDSQVVSGEATEDVSVEDAPAKAIRLRRNDQYVEANVVQLASSGLQLAATIQDLMNRIQDNAPKFGWYLEAQTQVMQGTFSLKWGWREYASPGQMHRAFYWLCLEADIALLQVSVEMGIGVEGFGFSLQVYGQIEGEVRLKASVQRISPEGDKGIKAVLKGEILGALGARFDAPYLVEAKGVVKTKLIVEGELRLRQDDGLRLTLDNYWNGITALVSWAVGPQTIHGKKKKEKTKSIEVVSPPEGKPGFLLSQWTWPDESRYEPERLPRSDVKAIFKEVFNAGHVILGGKYDVRVREHGHRERTDEDLFGRKEEKPDYTWWSMDEVVEAVVEKIEQRPHLDLRRKAVEALAIEIRKHLEDMMEAHNEEHLETLRDSDESPDIPWRKRHLNLDWKREKQTPHLGAVEYEAFLESKEFGEMLDGYVDPIQKQLHEIEQDAANA